jgi:hypothetical protein
MKKVILILAIALFASCTQNEPIVEPTTEINCNCWTVVSRDSFNIINGQGGVTVIYKNRLRNDCTFELRTQSTNLPMWTKVCN